MKTLLSKPMTQIAKSGWAIIVDIRNKDPLFLIARRSKNSNHPGSWNFPGGGIEKLEKVDKAIIREVYEEVGLQAGSMKLHDKFKVATRDKLYHVTIFTYKDKNDLNVKLDPNELDKYEWVTFEKLIKKSKILGFYHLPTNTLLHKRRVFNSLKRLVDNHYKMLKKEKRNHKKTSQ